MIENPERSKKSEEKIKNDFETRQNLSGFFELLLKIARREKIDIGQYEKRGDD